ncbi:hypothetical protein UPYG_G00326520 [Umbra pygmaea]|uniref:BZIP domain-containing protein n=1 Tax=Umbra pygmaea TaxID=75934 RepID=A0ABD0WPU9_UMBPY
MPQPGSSGMEPVFGEAYGTLQLSMMTEPFTISPTGGSTESDQCTKGVVVMLGPPVVPRFQGQQSRCELLSDLLEDVTSDETHCSDHRWDISALEDITHYAKGSPQGATPSCESSSVSPEREREVPWLFPKPRDRQAKNPTDTPTYVGFRAGHLPLVGRDPGSWSLEGVGQESETMEELHQVGKEQMVSPPLGLEVQSEEHNYTLQSEPDTESGQEPDSDVRQQEKKEDVWKQEKEKEKLKDKRKLQSRLRPKKRRCCWDSSLNVKTNLERDGERDEERDDETDEEQDEGNNIIWGPNNQPSTMCLEDGTNGKQCQRKARRTDASDLTPSPWKLQSLGEQLHMLSSALEGLAPVSDLPATARARTRKERNKLASRACRLKKKAQHEANKIKLWGLNQEYDGLLAAVLQIKELIRLRVESREEVKQPGALRERLEDILKASAGPRVAGRGKAFVERMLKSLPGNDHQRDSGRRKANPP